MTRDINKDQQEIMADLSQELEWPNEEEILCVFESSLQKFSIFINLFIEFKEGKTRKNGKTTKKHY